MDPATMGRWLEEQLRATQEQLSARRVTGESGGGLVKVTVDGKGDVMEVRLDPLCVDSRDVAMLEALVRAATNQALAEARKLAAGSGIDNLMRQMIAAGPLGGMFGGSSSGGSSGQGGR